jgi:type II secretory pathway component PulF
MATMPSTKPLPSGPKSLNLPKLVSEENLFAEVTIPAWALYHLTDKLNTLLSSGFSLQQAFPVLRKSLPTRENYSFVDRLRHKADPLTIMRSIENDIMDRGYLLSQAMERFPRVFDTHYI